jgi:hypothetical protein
MNLGIGVYDSISTGVGRGGARSGAGRRKGTTTVFTVEQIARSRAKIQTDKISHRGCRLLALRDRRLCPELTSAFEANRKRGLGRPCR